MTMIILTICVLIIHSEIAAISIQIPNTFIVLGRTDIVINCLVNKSTIESIIAIQLRRPNNNIVSILKRGVSWQDKKLENRANATGSLEDVQSSYLQLTVSRQNVSMDDAGTYFCRLSAQNRLDKSFFDEDSEEKSLNITEVKNNDTSGVSGHKDSQPSVYVLLVSVAVRFTIANSVYMY